MIKVEFYVSEQEELVGFSVRGHAGYDKYGSDIVCSAVTSAVELVANGITEVLKADATAQAFENEVKFILHDRSNAQAIDFIKALRLHLELLATDYSDHIRIIDTEV